MEIFKKAVNELGITALYEVRNLINQYICEDLGISDYVGNETDNLYNVIINKLKDIKWKTFIFNDKKVNDVKQSVLQFEYKFNNIDINVFVNAYNFKDLKTRNIWENIIPNVLFDTANSSYGKTKLPISGITINPKQLSLNVLLISGTVNKDYLHRSIRHELRHIYEQMQNNHRNFAGRDDNTLYMHCSDAYNNSQIDTPKNNIGLLGYMSFNYERHAFVEEYYDNILSLINKSNKGDVEANNKLMTYLRNDNEVMDKIVKMRFTLSKLQNNDEEYVNIANEILKGTGFTLGMFIKRCEESIHDLAKRYGKCIVKAKKDFTPLFDFNKYNTITYYENKGKPYAEWYI